MKKACVVIGAGYGDEGKGLMTDFLSNDRTMVVRFNGGAQAGHTVVTPDGRRHVFGHFGAGTFRGASTFLSKHFVVNPMLFFKELTKLGKVLSAPPAVYVDREAIVTTPYDIMLNQAVEQKRGASRHGSCGVGFGETIERSQGAEDFVIRMKDLLDSAVAVEKLQQIKTNYIPRRLHALKLKPASLPYLDDDDIIVHYMKEVKAMLTFVTLVDNDIMLSADNLVFEGAQGLAIDMTRGVFPYVTRSNCGIKNVLDLATDVGIDHLDVSYMSRAYTTRHGAGPLPDEVKSLRFANVEDKTNIYNDYQHGLRFAPINVDKLQTRIMDDIIDSFGSGVSLHPRLGITCVDQLIDKQAELRISGRLHQNLSHEEFLDLLTQSIGLKDHFYSAGPTRLDVYGYNKLELVI
jgi:adenylosuccinate synthase